MFYLIFLYQISKQVNLGLIDDAFCDAHLFKIDIISPKYVIYYLTKGTFSIDYSDI